MQPAESSEQIHAHFKKIWLQSGKRLEKIQAISTKNFEEAKKLI